MEERQTMSETLRLGVILSIAGGFLDAYTYLLRGKVFANAQTGNFVLFAVRVAGGDLPGALRYLLPVTAFMLGILVVELVRIRYRGRRVHWKQVILLTELLAVAAAGLMPPGSWDMPCNILLSFVCALQVGSFRSLNGDAYATTMCIGNLRSATEHLVRRIVSHDTDSGRKSIRYFASIAAFVLGAAISALLAAPFGAHAALFACLPLLAALLLLFL